MFTGLRGLLGSWDFSRQTFFGAFYFRVRQVFDLIKFYKSRFLCRDRADFGPIQNKISFKICENVGIRRFYVEIPHFYASDSDIFTHFQNKKKWENGAVKRSLTVEIEVTSLLPKEVSRFIFESSSLILLFFSKRLGRLG